MTFFFVLAAPEPNLLSTFVEYDRKKMRRKRIYIAASYLMCHLFLLTTASSQWCAYEWLANKTSEVEQNKLEVKLQSFDNQLIAEERKIYTIPVVVHIVFENERENISDAQILSQIDVLNTDFRKLNFNVQAAPIEFRSLAADVGIEFCLANIDPQGKPTKGITRTPTDILNIGSNFGAGNRRRIYYSSLGGIEAWSADKYLNIWVCSLGDGTLGYSVGTLAAIEEDGVVVDYQAFGTTGVAKKPYNLGRTTTHEVGHYFNLKHTWGDRTNCTGDDLVADTPPQTAPYFGCPSYPQSSCGVSNMFMNYMDYSDDACRSLFSEGQKKRMLGTLLLMRNSLLTSDKCHKCNNNSKICAYPNPANNFLYFNIAEQQIFDIEFFDVTGKKVENYRLAPPETGRNISVANIPSGTYIIKIRTSTGENFIEKILLLR